MRYKINTAKSKRLFRATSARTQSLNYAAVPMRGGFRI